MEHKELDRSEWGRVEDLVGMMWDHPKGSREIIGITVLGGARSVLKSIKTRWDSSVRTSGQILKCITRIEECAYVDAVPIADLCAEILWDYNRLGVNTSNWCRFLDSLTFMDRVQGLIDLGSCCINSRNREYRIGELVDKLISDGWCLIWSDRNGETIQSPSGRDCFWDYQIKGMGVEYAKYRYAATSKEDRVIRDLELESAAEEVGGFSLEPKKKEAWIEELRSGLYIKAGYDGYLFMGGKYTSLGVYIEACELTWEWDDKLLRWTSGKADPYLRGNVPMSEIPFHVQRSLLCVDRLCGSFDEVADWIEVYL